MRRGVGRGKRYSAFWLTAVVTAGLLAGCSFGSAGLSSNSTVGEKSTTASSDPGATATAPIDDGSGYIFYEASPETVSLHLRDPDGKPYGQLETLRTALETNGQTVRMLTNSGIYAPGQTPAGLHVQEGEEVTSLNLLDGEGNFQLLPNGVFYIADGEAGVLESNRYAAANLTPRLAVQSGPQLLLDGKIHPEFSETSVNTFVRNGVGVLPNGNVVFLLSRQPVTFWNFAAEFQRRGVENALYLDGKISAMAFPTEGEALFPNIPYAGMLVVAE